MPPQSPFETDDEYLEQQQRYGPGAHPDSDFARLQASRHISPAPTYTAYRPVPADDEAPPPPPHRSARIDSEATTSLMAGGAMEGANMREASPPHDRELYPHSVASNARLDANTPYGAGGVVGSQPSLVSRQSVISNPFDDHRYSRSQLSGFQDEFDPNSIEDDGDDGLEYGEPNRSTRPGQAGAAAAGTAATGGFFSKLFGRGQNYDPVDKKYNANGIELGRLEKSPTWVQKQASGNKRRAWIVGGVLAVIIIAALVGGIVGGLLAGGSNSSSTGQSAADDEAQNGDLNANSAEIKALMNNPDLHKVFPGIDYTPMNTQYPDCLTNPPSQNNVTRDLAVLSQLSNTVRLYGTDCNQTDMLLHSIDALNLNGTIKVWGGVWLDNNQTTNTRQLNQMYQTLDKWGSSSFVGFIVGNEVLFRQDMTATQLGDIINDVRSNLTARNIDLPVATSDLGDDWTQALADDVDYVMANIHPFFAGVTAEQAAGWTWQFWQWHDVQYKTDKSKNIISETGWPSQGGTDCGAATTCDPGSVAGISEMNTFMDDWVCQSLTNGTTYFWFEAFDEPWKIKYDTPGKEWEDHWGLLDVDRNLKSGIKIPDCGGRTVD